MEVLPNCKYKRVSIHIRRFCQEESSLRRVLVLKEGRLSQSPWEDTKDSENSLSVCLARICGRDGCESRLRVEVSRFPQNRICEPLYLQKNILIYLIQRSAVTVTIAYSDNRNRQLAFHVVKNDRLE